MVKLIVEKSNKIQYIADNGQSSAPYNRSGKKIGSKIYPNPYIFLVFYSHLKQSGVLKLKLDRSRRSLRDNRTSYKRDRATQRSKYKRKEASNGDVFFFYEKQRCISVLHGDMINKGRIKVIRTRLRCPNIWPNLSRYSNQETRYFLSK